MMIVQSRIDACRIYQAMKYNSKDRVMVVVRKVVSKYECCCCMRLGSVR
jgi:hypothetical protein